MIFAADRWREILIMNQLDKLTPGNFRQGFEKPGTFQVAILQGPKNGGRD